MLAGQWSEALAANNIITIFHWLKKLNIKGDSCLEEHLQTFGCWLQRTSEFTKKELLSLCFSRCQGLWMFLDRSSFIKVHMLLQRLLNLLILVQWSRKQLGVGAPCMICRDTQHSSDARQSCWNQELWTLKQHIWLGRLVQWWGIMGLLPRSPEAQELRRISQMWREMELSHQEMCLKTAGWNKREMERCGFLIEGMVMQLCKRHGCIWTSEDCTDQCYPPPTLEALLKLVLVPSIDIMSVQGILLYFILDVANFLQCKDNLLQSFCHAFTIPHSFSHQIKAFWMFDHGSTKASMELLLSPRATVPQFSWQHRCIMISLLKRKQHHMALKYLQWAKPPIETIEDAKLCAEVLLQSSCLSDAWALLKSSHTENEDMVMYFLQACRDVTLGDEAVKYIHQAYNSKEHCSRAEATILQLKNKGPLLKHSHVFESTITLQRISAFLTDQESQSKGVDEEKESYFTSVDGFLPHRSELKLSPDGATEQNSLSDLDQSLKSQDKVISYALQGEEDKKYTPGEKVSDAATKMVSSVFHKKDDQSDVFLAMSGDQEGRELLQQRETRGCGIQDYSSTPSTSPQDLVTDPNQSFVSEDIPLTGSPTINNAASPCVLDPSFAYSLANFIDFSAKHTDDKQGGGEKPAGWRGKAPQQGAMSGRTQCRKGKRVKRT
ncbi:protein ELYS-like isoform 3-T3 [Anableps anableps]